MRATGGLHLAITIRDGLEAYACDGISRKGTFSGRARPGRLVLRNAAGDRLALRVGARRAHDAHAERRRPVELTARRARVAIIQATIRADGAVTGTARGGA